MLTQLGLFPPPSDTEANKAILLRVFNEVYQGGDVDVIDEICAPDYIYRRAGNPDIHGPEGFKQFAASALAAYPDIQFTVDDMIAVGDKVVSRWTFTGTHKGELGGIPPTGKRVTQTGITISQLANGKLIECRTFGDVLGGMQQLGVIPANRENYTWGEPSEVTGDPGNPEENKAITQRLIEELWNQQNLDILGETTSVDFVAHSPVEPNNPIRGLEATKQTATTYYIAFPDLYVTIDEMLAVEDKVIVRWTTNATHGGELMGMPPTGKKVMFTGVTIYRFADGKLVENWWAWDALGLMQQLTTAPVDTEANKALLRQVFEESYGKGNLEIIDELFVTDYTYIRAGYPDVHGPEGFKQVVTETRAAFPDLQIIIDGQVAEGNKVVTRWTYHGTQQPAGKKVTGTGITISQIVDGKFVECRTFSDVLGTLQQIGVIPPDRTDFSWGEPSEVTGEPGDLEENKDITHRVVQEFWNQKELDVLDETHSSDFITHSPVITGMFPHPQIFDAYKQACLAHLAAIPDMQVTIDDTIAEGDSVVLSWTVNGTHSGEFMGVPPTEVPLTFSGDTIYRFADGNIVENWWAYDALGLMQQMGIIPSMVPKDYSNVFFMPLTPGLNMISLPLESQTPYTARSFAEKLSATVVIRLDENSKRFVGFTLDAPDDGFAIEGGKGYIVNVPEGGMVAFTGAAWTRPPMPAAPDVQGLNPRTTDGVWAFAVSGRLVDDSNDALKKDGYLVTVRNTRTNAIAADVVRSRYFAAAFADLNRKDVVEVGDRLEIQVRNQTGEIVSDTLHYTVTSDAIRQAFLPIILKNVEIPKQNLLLPNYPNPFNPETWIPYQIQQPAEVVIRIYSTSGQLVRTLDLGQRAAGFYLGTTRAAYWNGHNDAGEKVASGIYFYQIQAGDFTATRRMLVLK